MEKATTEIRMDRDWWSKRNDYNGDQSLDDSGWKDDGKATINNWMVRDWIGQENSTIVRWMARDWRREERRQRRLKFGWLGMDSWMRRRRSKLDGSDWRMLQNDDDDQWILGEMRRLKQGWFGIGGGCRTTSSTIEIWMALDGVISS
ncbi:hypothetical protein GCK72_017047 [Caenorhabditis remanei]|uniref:Uncharacterized protein n=1 Tax=Caenorhabditis remanei TaxID=31234 RepID=A0A6A5G6A0_CAERE|nr:hypothetical protein GCK72_017047 [Caenorhabditis remanei]KAF1750497.1 hypothetical protein GCK72_017047 [Caenorhabditis remanei]